MRNDKVFTTHDRARALPAPNAKFPVIVPLELLPAYLGIHNSEPFSCADHHRFDSHGLLIAPTLIVRKRKHEPDNTA